jgi:CYTH domain-containing protein
MDKTNRTEIQRLFLLEGLPEPLTRASSHIQIFDNYISKTRMRLRSVRVPESKEWTHTLQQRFPSRAGDLSCMKFAEIHLNESEYERFRIFEGTETRKNRYFHEFDGRVIAFDLFLGNLWGLNMAKVELDGVESAVDYEPPPFALFEVTGEPFFDGESLVNKKFEDVQAEVMKLVPLVKGIEETSVD